MKMFGIIAAMEEEISYIISKMQIKVIKSVIGLDFHIGTYAGKSVILVRCGIGKVNAAVCTQILIDHFAVDFIVNIGVAGAIFKELSIGDIVISKDVVHHDFNCEGFGYAKGVIPRMEDSFFKADGLLIETAKKASENIENVKTYVARIASGDQFISSSDIKAHIWNTYSAYCVEMEGAAIAQTCYLNGIPFVIIRSISDTSDESANVKFTEFVKISAKNSGLLLTYIIEMVFAS